MADLDPKALIDMPGAGAAQKAVRDAGAWDEGLAPGAVHYEVMVFATVTFRQIVRVKASSEAIAMDIAGAEAVRQGAWDWSRPDTDDIDHTEIYQ